ncbi:hypothetical protein [Nocardia sp. NPDC049707]|uniref:hypothetical protein n=1 Tax=Nocardia sp. NPDC049707 TaxID=3154735 RepID=UPI003449C38D
MISVPILEGMAQAATASRLGKTIERTKKDVAFEAALLFATVGLNAGPHVAVGDLGRAAEYAVAPVMVVVLMWRHASIASRYAKLIDAVTTDQPESHAADGIMDSAPLPRQQTDAAQHNPPPVPSNNCPEHHETLPTNEVGTVAQLRRQPRKRAIPAARIQSRARAMGRRRTRPRATTWSYMRTTPRAEPVAAAAPITPVPIHNSPDLLHPTSTVLGATSAEAVSPPTPERVQAVTAVDDGIENDADIFVHVARHMRTTRQTPMPEPHLVSVLEKAAQGLNPHLIANEMAAETGERFSRSTIDRIVSRAQSLGLPTHQPQEVRLPIRTA